jgi:hypothetical protein
MSNGMAGIRINQDIVFREEEEGAFLFDPDTGRICYLNELGVDIWKSCAKAREIEQVIEDIYLDFPEVSKEQIEIDCMKFFEDLKKLGFLSGRAKETKKAP